jgi:hypothetical protein
MQEHGAACTSYWKTYLKVFGFAEINNGPLSVLQQSVKNHSQILVALRNGRKILARCKAFDRHSNLVLENCKGDLLWRLEACWPLKG